jgi:hypothetical protein
MDSKKLEQYKIYFDAIQDPAINKLVRIAIEEYGNDTKIKDAISIYDWVIFLLKNDKLVSDNNYALFVDVLRAAALTHNLKYNYIKDSFEKVFEVRNVLTDINSRESIGVPETYLESICQAIESQLGKDHPVVALMPNQGTPAAHFALACSLYYKTGKTVPKIKHTF